MVQKYFLRVKIEKFVELTQGKDTDMKLHKNACKYYRAQSEFCRRRNEYTNVDENNFHFRTGEVEEEAIAHEGNKAARAIYLKNGLVFTTGFTKHSERQYSLRAPGHLDDPIVMVELDTSNGVMFPLYDPDANLVYLCGKVSFLLDIENATFQKNVLFTNSVGNH